MRHSNCRPKKHSSLWAVLCAAAFLVAIGIWYFQPTSEHNLEFNESTTGELENPFAKSPTNPFAETAESRRLIYPYSVVPGGAHRPEELRRAIASDRVVAAHYSDFDVSNARVVKLPAAKTAYVSYRIKDRVYWTQKKVTLAKGEKLITDGKNYVRARCANRVSDSAQAAVSPQEPSPAVMDTPVSSDAPALMAYLPSAVRRELVPDVLGGSNTGGGSGAVSEGGTPSAGLYGRPGYGGAAFLPAAVGSGGGGTSSGGGTPAVGGGTPGSGTPGEGGGSPAGGTGGGTGNGSPGSNPPGTPGSGTGTPESGSGGSNPPSQPGGGSGTIPGGNTPDGQPSGGEGSTPPNQGGGTGNPSSPGSNPPSGKGSEPGLNPPPQGGGSTPPNSNPGGPGDSSTPGGNPFTPPGNEGNETPIDVTIPPDGGGPNPTPPTTAVPEPASVWLLTAGAASLLAFRKRKK